MALTLRFMTFNIDSNRSVSNAAGIGDVIFNQNPHVVGMQEVCYNRMEAIVSHLYTRGWAAQIWRYHRSLWYGGACGDAYGNAILARVALSNPAYSELPPCSMCRDKGERRLIMSVDLPTQPSRIKAYSTHISPGSIERGVDQIGAAARWTDLAVLDNKVVMCDLNYPPDTQRVIDEFYSRFREPGGNIPTYYPPSDPSTICSTEREAFRLVPRPSLRFPRLTTARSGPISRSADQWRPKASEGAAHGRSLRSALEHRGPACDEGVGRMSEAALSIGLSLEGVYVDDAGTAAFAVGSGESPEGIRQLFTSSDFAAAREDLDIPEPDEMLVLELVGPSAAGAESEVDAAIGGADDA